jgi:kinesin family member 1
MPAEASGVQVAVRVRPFNKRERDRGAKLIVRMQGGTTFVKDPETDKERPPYQYDFAIWSHDQENGEFKSQDDVRLSRFCARSAVSVLTLSDLVVPVLQVYGEIGVPLYNAFWEDDFNVCMFAYGQSGSGKSFSMTGEVNSLTQRGVIPRICENILKAIEVETGPQVKFQCTVGMLEIYLEEIQDLLIPKKNRPKKGLQIIGGAVKGLIRLPVKTVKDILAALDQGHNNATIKPTGLNPESSRGHSVFEVMVKKTVIDPDGKEIVVEKIMRLIDLAGSERVDKVLEISKSGSMQDGKVPDAKEIAARLEEGKSINQSLTALGNCIKKVAEITNNHPDVLRKDFKSDKDYQTADKASQTELKKKLAAVSWRDTKLTHLLKYRQTPRSCSLARSDPAPRAGGGTPRCAGVL